jgi:hypothetical protein
MSKLYVLGIEAHALLDAPSDAGRLTAATARDLIAVQCLGSPSAAGSMPRASRTGPTSRRRGELAEDTAAFAKTGRDAIIG